MITRIVNFFLYIFLGFMIMQDHLVIALLAAALFTFRCGAIWLLPLAFAIDGYFGAFYHVPMVSIVAVVWYLLSELIRPRLLLQYETSS